MSVDGNLRPLFRQNLPQIFFTSIETGGTGRGVPDSYGCGGGVSFWIEYKLTSTWAVSLRPEQVAWLSRHARAGGKGFVAVRRKTIEGPRKGPACDELYLVPGFLAAELKKHGLKAVPFQRHEGGPSKWKWPTIGEMLLGG